MAMYIYVTAEAYRARCRFADMLNPPRWPDQAQSRSERARLAINHLNQKSRASVHSGAFAVAPRGIRKPPRKTKSRRNRLADNNVAKGGY